MNDSLVGKEVEAIHEHIRGVVTHEVGDSVVIDGRWEVSRSSVRLVEEQEEAA